MPKTIVETSMPKAGPYSPAVVAGGLCFVSGQVGFDPHSGGLADGGIEGEFRQAISNLSSVLSDAGCSLVDVVSTTIYVTDLSEFGSVNTVFGEAFGESPPTRATVQVSALPVGASVEIEAIAAIP